MVLKPKISFVQALEKIDRLKDGLGKPIDRKIRNLVAALIMMGVRTVQSCQGHSRGRYHSYPWIRFDERDVAIVTRVLALQNRTRKFNRRTNRNIWVILPCHRPEIVPWNTNLTLRTLQKHAEEFAEYILQCSKRH